MHIILAIAAIALALLAVGVIVAFVVEILAYIAAIVTIPSLAVMGLIRFLGLTDPGWFVVLHALLGGVIGFWAHRIFQPLQRSRQRLPGEATSAVDNSGGASLLQSVRQRSLRETVAEIWANRTHRFIAILISILVFLVLMSC